MCGVNGIYTVNEGGLTTEEVLTYLTIFEQSELRGTHASGICWKDGDNALVEKAPLPASRFLDDFNWERLVGKEWVFGHARHATVGSYRDNNNNHPIVGANKQVVLVHNGQVTMSRIAHYNYSGEVDTEVLVSHIEENGFDALKSVRGSASLIWTTRDEIENLFLWRLSNPLWVAVHNGVYYMASEKGFLIDALWGLKRTPIFSLDVGWVYKLSKKGLKKVGEYRPAWERWRRYKHYVYESGRNTWNEGESDTDRSSMPYNYSSIYGDDGFEYSQYLKSKSEHKKNYGYYYIGTRDYVATSYGLLGYVVSITAKGVLVEAKVDMYLERDGIMPVKRWDDQGIYWYEVPYEHIIYVKDGDKWIWLKHLIGHTYSIKEIYRIDKH